MDKAELILYGAATYLAIKSLVSLMSDHRQAYKIKLAGELKSAVPVAPSEKKVAIPPGKRTATPTSKPAVAKNAPNTPVKNPANETATAESAAK
jgi:hypothetical protein